MRRTERQSQSCSAAHRMQSQRLRPLHQRLRRDPLPLLLRQIQLAAQIDCVLFQFPNLLPAILEKRLRRQQFKPGEPLLRLLIEQG